MSKETLVLAKRLLKTAAFLLKADKKVELLVTVPLSVDMGRVSEEEREDGGGLSAHEINTGLVKTLVHNLKNAVLDTPRKAKISEVWLDFKGGRTPVIHLGIDVSLPDDREISLEGEMLKVDQKLNTLLVDLMPETMLFHRYRNGDVALEIQIDVG